MYAELKGRTAVVTGAGKESGIGFAIAEALAATGMNLLLTDIGQDRRDVHGAPTGTFDELETLAARLTGQYAVEVQPQSMDVTDAASIAAAVAAVGRRWGRMDVVVNNAGAALGVPAEVRCYDEEAWMKTIDINLHGVFRVSRAFLPLMKGKTGSIVNMASRAGKTPPLWNGAYAVAKAGVIMLTKVMALELAAEGIRVNAICPGLIKTGMQDWRIELESQLTGDSIEDRQRDLEGRVPMNVLGKPSQVADLAVFLASSRSAYITGQALNVCGGQTMEV
jgi:NAD(P)-dependent dehydrogenase (short-subunit alcohol dehydrogenase family)